MPGSVENGGNGPVAGIVPASTGVARPQHIARSRLIRIRRRRQAIPSPSAADVGGCRCAVPRELSKPTQTSAGASHQERGRRERGAVEAHGTFHPGRVTGIAGDRFSQRTNKAI